MSIAQDVIRDRQRRKRRVAYISKALANYTIAAMGAWVVSAAGAPTWGWLATGVILAWGKV